MPVAPTREALVAAPKLGAQVRQALPATPERVVLVGIELELAEEQRPLLMVD